MVVKTSFDFMNIVVFYIPEFITDNQKEWIDNNIDRFSGYDYIGFNNYSVVDDNIREDKVKDIEKEKEEIVKRYKKYKGLKEEKGHVR